MDSHDGPFNYDKGSHLLSAESRELQRMVRSFAENEIQSAQLEMDRNHEFPYECWEKWSRLGMAGATLPEQYGGADIDALSYIVAIE